MANYEAISCHWQEIKCRNTIHLFSKYWNTGHKSTNPETSKKYKPPLQEYPYILKVHQLWWNVDTRYMVIFTSDLVIGVFNYANQIDSKGRLLPFENQRPMVMVSIMSWLFMTKFSKRSKLRVEQYLNKKQNF